MNVGCICSDGLIDPRQLPIFNLGIKWSWPRSKEKDSFDSQDLPICPPCVGGANDEVADCVYPCSR